MKHENLQYITRRLLLRKNKKNQHELERKLKILKKSFYCDRNIEKYQKYKADWGKIYHNIAEGVNIRSKCQFFWKNQFSFACAILSKSWDVIELLL